VLRKSKRYDTTVASKKEAIAPLPGRPVRGSATGRPIMALLDLLGRRWTLRILWELRSDTLGFRELQSRCDDMSASVLNQRLSELREAGVVEQGEGGYRLTGRGRELLKAFAPLERWAKTWRLGP
jgi:DNA-binding HxlR family transcriptional regulator